MTARDTVREAARLVVKVGSSSLTTAAGGLDPGRLDRLVDALAARRAAGTQLVLVSSGAIAAGLAPLGLPARPRDLATQQAAASVGQMLLVERYAAAFARAGLTVGQVLLTADDLVRRAHYRNAHRTLERLLQLGVVPVVNENDAVATEEIRFGDNDRLAALVAHLVRADALVLLSDVDGLYDGDPRRPGARLLPEVSGEADLDGVRFGRTGASGIGTGGMASKLDAVRIAAGAGVPVLLAAAEAVGPALAGRAGRHGVPAHRRAHPFAAVLAAARHHPARPAGARRRRGRGSGAPPDLAAVRRGDRRPGRLRRRRPGRAGRPGRRAGGSRAGRLRRRRAAAAARPVQPRARPRTPPRGGAPGRPGAAAHSLTGNDSSE